MLHLLSRSLYLCRQLFTPAKVKHRWLYGNSWYICFTSTGKQRSRGTRQVGLLIADILSPHRPLSSIEERKKKRKISSALSPTVCSPSGEARSLSRLVTFSWQGEKREGFFSSWTGRQKGPWNPGARCHRHSHRSHPIIFKLSKRALRPYIRLDVCMRAREQVNDGSEPPASPLHANLSLRFFFLSFFD